MERQGTIKMAITVAMAVMLYTCQGSSNLHPLVLVPGAFGSQIEARLTEQYRPSSAFCDRKDDSWFRLWFDISVLLRTQCFVDRMTLHYNASIDDYRNTPGVETRVPDFGSTRAILYSDPHLKQITEYMASLVKSLEQIGYVDGETLFGAPYDFRYGLAAKGHPSHVGSKFLQDLKDLIEAASTSNGGKPVILISHSLGGLFVLQLLNRNSPSWRQKYIKHLVALSTPWGGAVYTMFIFTYGNTLGYPLNHLLMREAERTFESNLWIMPTPELFGHDNPLVITPNATYTAYDIPQFLNDIGFPQGVHPYESRVLPMVERLVAPEVPITCVIGTGIETPDTLLYRESGFDQEPEVVTGDGDGLVNMVSLLAIESEWADEKNQTLKFIKIHGVDHTSILIDDAALEQIIGEICLINSQIVLPLVSVGR